MDYEINEIDDAMVMEDAVPYDEQTERKPIDFKIVEHMCVFKSNERGWAKELNLVSWGGRQAKFDIREWSPDHKKMSKGITLTDVEAEALFKWLARKGVGSADEAVTAI